MLSVSKAMQMTYRPFPMQIACKQINDKEHFFFAKSATRETRTCNQLAWLCPTRYTESHQLHSDSMAHRELMSSGGGSQVFVTIGM